MELERLGLDVEHIGADTVEAQLQARSTSAGCARRATTRACWSPTRIAATAATGRRRNAARRAASRRACRPGGHDRTLDEYNVELRSWPPPIPAAEAVPAAVPLAARQARVGIEISHDVHTDSGKPVFLNTGVHYAPTGPLSVRVGVRVGGARAGRDRSAHHVAARAREANRQSRSSTPTATTSRAA